MREFDELLEEVLREDARAEPSLGMERRVLAKVAASAGRPSRRWRILVVVAAGTVAAGVMVWVNVSPIARPVPKLSGRSSLGVASRTAPTDAGAGRVRGEASELQPVERTLGTLTLRKTNTKGVKSSPVLLRGDSNGIGPIEIAPLTVGSIEIASLIRDRGHKKREMQ